MAIYEKGSTSVSEIIVLRDSTTHIEKTAVDVTTLDLYYTTKHATGGYTLSAKADVAAVAANAAWASASMCEIAYGEYRLDIPDAVFVGTNGLKATVMIVGAGIDNVHLYIELSPKVDVTYFRGLAVPASPFPGIAMYIDIELGLGGGGGVGYLGSASASILYWSSGYWSDNYWSDNYWNETAGGDWSGTSVNKSALDVLTVTPTLYGALAADLTYTVTFSGGHSQAEDKGVGKHFTLASAGATITNTAYNTTTVSGTVTAGNTTGTPITMTIVNNPTLEKDRAITISSPMFGAPKTVTIVDTALTALNYFDITDYGTVGDGITDDTVAIAAALAAANSAVGANSTSDQAIVYFPDGTYKVYGHLAKLAGVHMVGQSKTGTVLTRFGLDDLIAAGYITDGGDEPTGIWASTTPTPNQIGAYVYSCTAYSHANSPSALTGCHNMTLDGNLAECPYGADNSYFPTSTYTLWEPSVFLQWYAQQHNLVTNGTFDTDASWTKGTDWTIDAANSNKAEKTAGTASNLEQDITAINGHRYQLEVVVVVTAGTVTPEIGGVAGTAISASGSYTQHITATGTGNLKFKADAAFIGSVDTVVVIDTAAQVRYIVENVVMTGSPATGLGAYRLTDSQYYNVTFDENLKSKGATSTNGYEIDLVMRNCTFSGVTNPSGIDVEQDGASRISLKIYDTTINGTLDLGFNTDSASGGSELVLSNVTHEYSANAAGTFAVSGYDLAVTITDSVLLGGRFGMTGNTFTTRGAVSVTDTDFYAVDNGSGTFWACPPIKAPDRTYPINYTFTRCSFNAHASIGAQEFNGIYCYLYDGDNSQEVIFEECEFINTANAIANWGEIASSSNGGKFTVNNCVFSGVTYPLYLQGGNGGSADCRLDIVFTGATTNFGNAPNLLYLYRADATNGPVIHTDFTGLIIPKAAANIGSNNGIAGIPVENCAAYPNGTICLTQAGVTNTDDPTAAQDGFLNMKYKTTEGIGDRKCTTAHHNGSAVWGAPS